MRSQHLIRFEPVAVVLCVFLLSLSGSDSDSDVDVDMQDELLIR